MRSICQDVLSPRPRVLKYFQERMPYEMDRNFPYVVLVNVVIADLQGLRDKAEEATRKFAIGAPSDYRVVEQNEAIFFCFEDPTARVLFEDYCVRNRIPHRRDDDDATAFHLPHRPY